ncbi:MAG: efflux RND transporter periplasmic adaptor subunit [Gemmatimonadota bacterium]
MIGSPARNALALIFGITLAIAGCGRSKAPDTTTVTTSSDGGTVVTPEQRKQILTTPVERKAFSPTILTTGTVQFNGDKSTQMLATISGPVSRLLVNTGDVVHPGQQLATVASPDFASTVADYRKAEASLRNAQRIATLDEKLYANDALARAELDQAHSDLAAAEADRDAALQQVAALGVDSVSIEAIRQGKALASGQSALRAPIAGVVVERLITQGQLLEAGATPTFTIADLSSVWVMGQVFESDAGSVYRGEQVMIRIDGVADSFPGRIDYVGALVDPDSKALGVRILVPNLKQRLKQNMLVRVEIRGSRAREGIVIPVAAVLRDDDNLPFVYVDAGKDHFSRRRIGLGGRTGDVYEVTSGLAAGEQVVIQGALFLQQAAGSQ